MPYIKVDPNALIGMAETLQSVSRKVGRIESSFYSTASRLDWDVKSASDIRGRINRIDGELEDQAQMLSKMQTFISNAKSKYESVQDEPSGGSRNRAHGGSTRSFGAITEKSWFDSVGESFRSAIDGLKNGICAGANAISKNLSDCKAYWVNNWNNKGWLYKTVKATGAVVSIVGSVAIAVSSIGAAIASGGALAPVAVACLLTLYNGNSVANSVADLYNIFGGDINQVGQTNFLKSGSKWLVGKAGELVGNKEAGEKAGEIVYTVGSVASTILSLKGLIGKVKQTNSLELGNSVKSATSAIKSAWTQNAAATFEEARYAVSQLAYIATKVPISQVGLQFSLFTGHLASLESTIQGMQLLSAMKQIDVIGEAVGTATKLIDAGIDVINLSNDAGFLDIPLKYVPTAPAQIISMVSESDDLTISDLLPEKVLKPGEIIDQAIDSATGISKDDMPPVDELKEANVHEGIKSIKDIVEDIVDAKEAWEFVARTSTQGG